MTRFLYGFFLVATGLILCRDAATLAIETFRPDQVRIEAPQQLEATATARTIPSSSLAR